jgi:hypothetical protein
MGRHLALICAVVAAAALVPTGSAITKPQVFSVLDITVRDVPIDPGFGENEIPRVGARSAFTDALYKWAGTKRGARVGRAEGLCTFVKVDPSVFEATVYCTVNAYLRPVRSSSRASSASPKTAGRRSGSRSSEVWARTPAFAGTSRRRRSAERIRTRATSSST